MIFLECIGSRACLSAKLGAIRRHLHVKSCKIKHLQDFSFSANKPRHDKKRRKTTGFCYQIVTFFYLPRLGYKLSPDLSY
mgnify:CR=1 FL=1